MFLQLAGVVQVAIALGQTGESFGQKSLVQLAQEWIRRAPWIRRETVTGIGAGSIPSLEAFGTATVWLSANQEADLKERIGVLEKNLGSLREHLSRTQSITTEQIGELSARCERIERELRTVNRELSGRLEAHAISGLRLAQAGLVWVFLGIIAATIPEELACIWNHWIG